MRKQTEEEKAARRVKVAEALRRRRARIRSFIDTALKSKPCADCGVTYHPFVMDLDHRPGEEKRFNVSAAVPLGFSEPIIAEEALKCDVVCSNCHRMRTLARMNGVRLPVPSSRPLANRTHCPLGHPYDAINTRVRNRYGLKHRECVTCIRARDVRRRSGKQRVKAQAKSE